jgi:HK97 family phage prohead protease
MSKRTTAPDGFDREVSADGVEIRSLTVRHTEARAADDGRRVIRGYGAVFNQVTTIGGFFYSWDEEVAPGAFDTALAVDGLDVRATLNHNVDRLLGRTTAGTLTLSTDDTGLLYEIDVNVDDPNAVSAWAQVERGDVSGSSIWFRVAKDEWTYPTEDNGLEREHRLITEIDPLIEVGPVVFPAFDATTAATRAVDQLVRAAANGSPEDLEARVRRLLAEHQNSGRDSDRSSGSQLSRRTNRARLLASRCGLPTNPSKEEH